MNIVQKYLLRRKDTYYFRLKVPKRLRPQIECREIKKSLSTLDLNKAEILSTLLLRKLNKLFCLAESEMFDREKFRQHFAKATKEALEFLDDGLATYSASQCELNREKKHHERNEAMLRDALMFNTPDVFKNLTFDAKTYLDNNVPDYTDEDLAIAIRERRKLYLTETKIRSQFFQGIPYEETSEYKELEQKYLSQPNIQIIQVPGAVTPAPVEKVMTLKEAVDAYVQDKGQSGGWTTRTKTQNQLTLSLICEVLGPKRDIKTITRQEFVDFRNNIMTKLPSNFSKSPQFRKKSLQQIVAMKNITPMSVVSINHYLTRIASFFNWADTNGYIVKSLAHGLNLKETELPDEQRKTFDREDIIRLLNALAEHRSKLKPYQYWIPLVALFTGARQNEIAQLYLDNFKVIDGIPCIHIAKTHDDQRLKTKSSIRHVPIHPILAQLGFLDFLIDLKIKGQPRPWMDVKARRDGYGQSVQRWFGRFNREFVTTDEDKVFHSFRHTFVDNLKQHGTEELKLKELVGHANESITTNRYGKKFTPEIQLDAIKRLDYEVDFFELLKVKPKSPQELEASVKRLAEFQS